MHAYVKNIDCKTNTCLQYVAVHYDSILYKCYVSTKTLHLIEKALCCIKLHYVALQHLTTSNANTGGNAQ